MLARAFRWAMTSADGMKSALLPAWSPWWWVFSTYLMGWSVTLATWAVMKS